MTRKLTHIRNQDHPQEYPYLVNHNHTYEHTVCSTHKHTQIIMFSHNPLATIPNTATPTHAPPTNMMLQKPHPSDPPHNCTSNHKDPGGGRAFARCLFLSNRRVTKAQDRIIQVRSGSDTCIQAFVQASGAPRTTPFSLLPHPWGGGWGGVGRTRGKQRGGPRRRVQH